MTTTTPTNAKAWKDAIELANNSFFVSRCFGFPGCYLFGATPFAAEGIERHTGGHLARVGSFGPGYGGEPPVVYWVIANEAHAERAEHAAEFVREVGVDLCSEAWTKGRELGFLEILNS